MNITPEQIRALRAGRTADRLAAEYVMGWKWFWWPAWDGAHKWRKLAPPDCEPHLEYKLWSPADGDMAVWNNTGVSPPDYSSDWDAMEQVVIQMRQRGWEWGMYSTKSGFMAGFSKTITLDGNAKFIKERAEESGAPLAVVKAALLALVAEKEANNG